MLHPIFFSRRSWLVAALRTAAMVAVGALGTSCDSSSQSPSEKSSATKQTATPPSGATVQKSTGDAPPLVIGLVAPFSGPFASSGLEMRTGIAAYLHAHSQRVAGRSVVVLERDTTGVAPAVAKRLAQQLVTNDQVDFLAGFALTPNAMAVASIATKSKTPMIVMNAATAGIPSKSPYIARVSFTLAQAAVPLAKWALNNQIDSAYSLVSDYAPGLDAEAQFREAFSKGGGKVVDSARVPLSNPDFAPYVQKIKDTKPKALFVFVPSGAQGIGLMKSVAERGLNEAGITLLATGSVMDDYQLPGMGDQALGVVSTHHYSLDHQSPENQAFKAAFAAVSEDKNLRANFMAVGGWDGMAAIAFAMESKPSDSDAVMARLANFQYTSPRGPISIDPATRDITQTVYVRRVEKKNGELFNVEFDQFPAVSASGQ